MRRANGRRVYPPRKTHGLMVDYLGISGSRVGSPPFGAIGEVRQALRKTLYAQFKLRDNDVFEKALGYVREY